MSKSFAVPNAYVSGSNQSPTHADAELNANGGTHSLPKTLDLSVIVPLYNEEESILPLFQAIDSALQELKTDSEIVLVDDGSRDKTFELAKQLAREHPRLRVIRFRKNYGQTAAMSAGMQHASGRILVTMDGDLQNDPSDIGHMVRLIHEGSDLVCGIRVNRQDKLFSRKLPSKVANWLIGKVTGVPIKDNGCSLKAYRADVIKAIPLYSEMHRFIPAMASMAGARITQKPVKHHARRFGMSKYGISRIYRVLLDLLVIKTLVAYVYRPLYWFSLMGLLSGSVSLLAFGVAIADIGNVEQPRMVMFTVSQLFGMLTIFLVVSGVLTEMIYKTGNFKIEALSHIKAKKIGWENGERSWKKSFQSFP